MKNIFFLILMFCGFLASAQITDFPVVAWSTNILSGQYTHISTTGSQIGYNYVLRDDSDNSIIAGPYPGTGNGLTFTTGVLNSSTTYNVFAANNYVLNFDTDYNYVDLSNDNRGIDKEVSIAAWIKAPYTGTLNIVMDYGPSDAGFLLRIDGSSATVSGRDNTGNFKTSGPSSTVVTDYTWHYIVGTINVTTGNWKIYVDGIMENSLTGSSGNTLANPDNLYIGNTFSTSDAYRGQIMNVTIWDKELSASEIATNMNTCLLGSENNIIGHFPLNEGTGNTINDYSSLAIGGAAYLSGASGWVNGNGTCIDGLEMSQTVTVNVDVPEPTVEMTDATTALFSWNAIPSATSYQVKYRLKNTTAWSTSGTSNTQRNVPNLTAKKYYQYKVRSQNSNGVWSNFSAVGLFYTSACDVPTGIASIYLDNTRMRIRWDNNPDEIKAKVRYREVGTSTWYTQNSGNGNNYIYINNLTPNAEYQYRVRSNCDGNDWSEYSASYYHDLASAQRIAVEPVSETKVYPNPARDVLFVEFDNENDEQVNITIIDGLGKTIQSSTNSADNGTQQIDISQIPNGYYFISIQKENSVETLKFLKVN